MKKRFFQVKGFELLERTAYVYPKQTSRVSVPNGWKKVVVIRVE